MEQYINKPALKTGIEKKLEEEKIRNKISDWWKEHYAKTFKNYTFEGYSWHYMENSTIVNLAQYFYELGANSK